MFQVNSIAYGLLYSVASDTTIINSGYSVYLEPIDDEDIAQMPWVGIYLDGIDIEPARFGGPPTWDATLIFSMILRHHNTQGRLESIDALYRALDPVLTAVNSNKTLKGTVEIVNAITVEPFEMSRDDENFVQAMEIRLTAKQRSS